MTWLKRSQPAHAKVTRNVPGRRPLLAGGQFLKEPKQKKKLKLCAGWPGMGRCDRRRCWVELGISLPGRQARESTVALQSVQSSARLPCSELGISAAAGIACWSLATLFIEAGWTCWKFTDCWTQTLEPEPPVPPLLPPPPRNRGKPLSVHSLWLMCIHSTQLFLWGGSSTAIVTQFLRHLDTWGGAITL